MQYDKHTADKHKVSMRKNQKEQQKYNTKGTYNNVHKIITQKPQNNDFFER